MLTIFNNTKLEIITLLSFCDVLFVISIINRLDSYKVSFNVQHDKENMLPIV